MRKVKFRAWLKLLNKMVDVVEIDFDYEMICWIYEDKVNQEQSKEWSSFDDIELMQYTGIRDTRRTEICEGDIVEYGENIYTIRYWRGMYEPICYYRDANFSVIGNVHENPDLLVSNTKVSGTAK